MKVSMQETGDQGSKKKSTLRFSGLQQNFYCNDELNSKKKISWGGIHTRVFNEQENRNWDVSPQSLRSGSDKSRSIDVSNLTDEKIYEQSSNQQYEALQNAEYQRQQNALFQASISNNYKGQNQQQQQQQADYDFQNKSIDRLSLFFHNQNNGQTDDDSFLLPSSQFSQNQQEIFYRRANEDQNMIVADTKNISPLYQNNVKQVDQKINYGIQNNMHIDQKNAYNVDQKNNIDLQRKISPPLNAHLNGYMFQDAQTFNDDSQQYHESNESNLLDNIERMGRLSGLWNDSDSGKQFDPKSEILLPFKETQNSNISEFQKQQNVQNYNNNPAFEINNVKSKDVIFFDQDVNIDGKIANQKLQSNENKNGIQQGYFNQQQYPLNQVTNTITNENSKQNQYAQLNQQKIAHDENLQNVVFNNSINQNLFKNYHDVEKQYSNMMMLQPNQNQDQKNIQNTNPIPLAEKQIKNFHRLSEFYLDDTVQTEQKQNQKPEIQNQKPDTQNKKSDSQNKKQEISNQKQEIQNKNEEVLNKKSQNQKSQSDLNKKDQVIFDENFSQKNNDILDSSKRLYPFSLGYASDIFNESKSSGNESQSYILEYYDKVNSLSDTIHQQYDMQNEYRDISSSNRSKSSKNKNSNFDNKNNNNLYTPSPLINDLQSLNLDLEEGTDSHIKIIKEKKQRQREDLDRVKQGNLLSDEDENDQIANSNQVKSVNQKMVPEKNFGPIQKQKAQIKQQLNELITNNNSKQSPKKHSISKQILPNNSIQKEMKRLSEFPNQNNLKGILSTTKNTQSGNNSKEKQNFINKGMSQNKESKSNQGDSKSKSDWDIKRTPLRKSNRFADQYNDDNDDENDNLQELNQGVQELEKLVVRLPLNSYEKNVLLKVLTPGKQIQNLQQIRESFLFNNHNAKTDEIQQKEDNSDDQYNQHKDQTGIQQLNNEISSEEVIEQLCTFYQEKIKQKEKEVEEQQRKMKELEEIKRKNQEEIEKEDQELQQLEEKLKQMRQSKGQQQQQQTDSEKENQNPQIIKKNTCQRFVLYENQYWQAYQIIINYFGFEYVGKVKDKNQKGDMVAFKFLNRYLCCLQLAKQKQSNQENPSLILYKGEIKCITNSSETQLQKINGIEEKQFNSYSDLLSSPNIAKITQDLLHKNYKNYVTHQQNIIDILQYVGSKLIELEELYRQLRYISVVYTLSNFNYNLTTFSISFNLKLTQFPQKLVKFKLSPESWFNEIQIQIINNPQLSSNDIHSKLNEDIDNAINTSFNSKINSQASYQKLKIIIEAINIKNGIDQPNSERNSTSRMSSQQNPQNKE